MGKLKEKILKERHSIISTDDDLDIDYRYELWLKQQQFIKDLHEEEENENTYRIQKMG
jgi:hypothetical protein